MVVLEAVDAEEGGDVGGEGAGVVVLVFVAVAGPLSSGRRGIYEKELLHFHEEKLQAYF